MSLNPELDREIERVKHEAERRRMEAARPPMAPEPGERIWDDYVRKEMGDAEYRKMLAAKPYGSTDPNIGLV